MKLRQIYILLYFLILFVVWLPHIQAQTHTKESLGTVETKIFSDELVYSIEEQTIIFNKNVIVQRPDFNLMTEKLTIYLNPPKKPLKETEHSSTFPNSMVTGEIKNIIAEKNVRIEKDKYIGTCGKAIYTEKTGILVLEDSPILTDGENTVVGDSIRYYLRENRSEVIGKKNKRVEVTFSSNDFSIKEKVK